MLFKHKYFNFYYLLIAFLIFFFFLQARIVDKHSIKKKNKKLHRQKNFVSFLQISYEEKSNVLASRVTFLKQEWTKPQKETKKKWFVQRSRMKQKTKEKKEEKRKKNLWRSRIKKREERRVRIMHYSWWLLGLREKGLCSISVFETSTLPSDRERGKGHEEERENGKW